MASPCPGQLLVNLEGQRLGHVVVVLAEVWVFLLSLEVQLVLLVCYQRHGGGGVGGLVGRGGGGS